MRTFVLLFALGVLSGCGHMAKLRPTPKGQVAVELAVGGPFAKVAGLPLPLPLSTVGASVGIAEHVDLSAHFHPTVAAFGVGGLDLGASFQPLVQRGPIPAVTLLGRLYGFTDFKTGLAPYLEAGVTGSYRAFSRLSPYLNLSTLVQLNAPPLLALGAGLELELGRGAIQAEFRWFSPNHSTRFNAVEWQSIAGQGAWGVLVGGRVNFGEAR